MKLISIMTLVAIMLPTLALTEKRDAIILVKGSPTNYGTNGFDISWVDNSTQKYYLADRTNNAIDLADAISDTFLGFIGKGQYTGSKPCPRRPQDLRHCSGPNGVTTDDFGHVWAGDGIGELIETSETQPGTTVLRKIPTGGKFRVDEVGFDRTHFVEPPRMRVRAIIGSVLVVVADGTKSKLRAEGRPRLGGA
jgi:hypothetical protein